jgi:hypothetical protein
MKIRGAGLPLMVDAYQAGHYRLIPPGMENFQVSQITQRKPLHYGGDEAADNRLLHMGIALYIDDVLSNPITNADIEEADDIFKDFHAHHMPPYAMEYPWPKEMFKKIVNEYGGYLPICVTAL